MLTLNIFVYLILIFIVQHKGRSQVLVKMAFPFNKESFMNDDVRKALSEGFERGVPMLRNLWRVLLRLVSSQEISRRR